MIIWGSKAREQNVDSGFFYCPNCATTRPYRRVRLSRYFTLYFIPLFPTKQLAEYIECQHCYEKYKPEVLLIAQPATRASPTLSSARAATTGDVSSSSGNAAVERLLRSGLTQVVMADIVLGTPSMLIVSTLMSAGVASDDAKILESLLRQTFDQLPGDERTKTRDNMVKRMDTIEHGLRSGLTQDQVAELLVRAEGYSPEHAIALVEYAATLYRFRRG